MDSRSSTVKVRRATIARPQQEQPSEQEQPATEDRRVSIQEPAEQRSGSVSRRPRGESISQRVQRSFESTTNNPTTRPRGLTALQTIPSQSGLDFATVSRGDEPRADSTRRASISRASVDSGPVSPPQTVRVRVGSLRGRKSSEPGRRPSLSSAGPASAQQDAGDPTATTTARARAYTVGGALTRLRGVTFGGAAERPAVAEEDDDVDHHEAHEVDLLEVVDPAVGTAATLSQIQSAIFLPPNLGISYRRPVVDLAASPASTSARRRATTVSRPATGPAAVTAETEAASEKEMETVTEEEMLDEHLKDLVRAKDKRRQAIKRAWQGFLAFAKTPLGFCVCIYGFCVVFWGAALVLILIHAITFSSYHLYQKWVEICSQILNGLFTVPGVGLFPGRLWDWWNAGIILHYAKLTYRRRAKMHLGPLADPNDLPDPECEPTDADAANRDKTSSSGAAEDDDVEKASSNKPSFPGEGEGHVEHGPLEGCTTVLNVKEMARLRKAQSRLSKSQTWYRPHATHTHHAFPIKWMVVILSLNVSNSATQCCLCGVMWGLRYYNRPAWTTAVCIVLSFMSGIMAGVFIWQIGKRTRKTKEVLKHVEDAINADEKDIVEAIESVKEEDRLDKT